MVSCIIFDCDGVLVDSEMIAARVAAECFTEAGMPITAEELTSRFSGIGGDQVTAQLAAQFGVVPDAAMTEKRRHRIMTAFASELQAMTGVNCALELLAQVKCVASSSHPERIALSLQLTGIERHFGDRVYSSSMVSRGKPAPDLFLYAADQLGHLPRNCLVIEDSVHGVAAARRRG
jgi:HAD superfamily hydrolase (TIGR01509 family)